MPLQKTYICGKCKGTWAEEDKARPAFHRLTLIVDDDVDNRRYGGAKEVEYQKNFIRDIWCKPCADKTGLSPQKYMADAPTLDSLVSDMITEAIGNQ